VFRFLVDRAEVVERMLAVSTRDSGRSGLDLDFLLHVVGGHTSQWRCSSPTRVLDAFTDLDGVREHALDMIDPHD
jgi:hypothetical protein